MTQMEMKFDESWNDWQMTNWVDTASAEEIAVLESRAAKYRVTPWELTIFESIWYGYGQVRSQELLEDRAFGTSGVRFPTKAKAAVERSFEEGWIQFLSADFLSDIRDELHMGGFLTPRGLIGQYGEHLGQPIYGLISFTREGASLYQSWIGMNPQDPEIDHWAIGWDQDGANAVFGTSIYACGGVFDFQEPTNEGYMLAEESAAAVGRWCDCWWNRFDQGFRVRYSYQCADQP